MSRQLQGFILASLAVIIWSVTYVATRYLLKDFTALEIQLIRFTLAYAMLWIIHPKTYLVRKGDEKLFIGLGLFGAALYQFLENCAIYYTNASNVSIIVATAPIFTAMLGRAILKTKLSRRFYAGCLIAFIGVAIISLNGVTHLSFHPLGDIMAFLCMTCWGFYSMVADAANSKGYPQVFQIRRAFFWTVMFTLPLLLLSPTDFLNGSFHVSASLRRFAAPGNIAALVFLTFLASSFSFIVWNRACQLLGTVRCTCLIYLTPVIATLFAWLLIGETPTPLMLGGMGLTLLGVFMTRKN